MSRFDDSLRLGKRGELYVFTQLLQRGVVPYAPLLDIEAIDCVIRRPNGGFFEVQVKTNNTPKDPMWWTANAVPNREDYVLVLVSVPLNWDVWVLPATVFLQHATGPTGLNATFNLDLACCGREEKVRSFKNNWGVIVESADKEPVEEIEKGAVPELVTPSPPIAGAVDA